MTREPQRVDVAVFTSVTGLSLHRFRELVRVATSAIGDLHKSKRKKAQECKSCFYLSGRLGGSAITHRDCGICGKEMSFSNTCVDAFCVDCARKHKLCAHCGGDINMRAGRRKWPTKS